MQIGQNGCRENIDPSQQVVRRDHLVEVKLVKQLPLISVLPPHHRRLSCRFLSRNHCSLGFSTSFFDSIDPLRTLPLSERSQANYAARASEYLRDLLDEGLG
jgi:hypothetical protein